MSDAKFTPEQLEKLLGYASRRLGSTPEQLKALFQEKGLGGLAQVSSAMTPEEAAKAQELVRDKDKAAQLLNDPQVRQLLSHLLSES